MGTTWFSRALKGSILQLISGQPRLCLFVTSKHLWCPRNILEETGVQKNKPLSAPRAFLCPASPSLSPQTNTSLSLILCQSRLCHLHCVSVLLFQRRQWGDRDYHCTTLIFIWARLEVCPTLSILLWTWMHENWTEDNQNQSSFPQLQPCLDKYFKSFDIYCMKYFDSLFLSIWGSSQAAQEHYSSARLYCFHTSASMSWETAAELHQTSCKAT